MNVQVCVLAGLESPALTVTVNVLPAWTFRPGMADSAVPEAGVCVSVRLAGQLSLAWALVR